MFSYCVNVISFDDIPFIYLFFYIKTSWNKKKYSPSPGFELLTVDRYIDRYIYNDIPILRSHKSSKVNVMHRSL